MAPMEAAVDVSTASRFPFVEGAGAPRRVTVLGATGSLAEIWDNDADAVYDEK